MDILGGCWAAHHRGPVEELVQLVQKESPMWAWGQWLGKLMLNAKPSGLVQA